MIGHQELGFVQDRQLFLALITLNDDLNGENNDKSIALLNHEYAKHLLNHKHEEKLLLQPEAK